MHKIPAGAVLAAVLAAMLCPNSPPAGGTTRWQKVDVAVNEAGRRVDVAIDGKPFTSYMWPASLKKPVLYPLRRADGAIVTRGFPLEPRAAERVDHPHHAGLWFNYGNVNGFDFWNNSDAIKPEDRPKMGTVIHQSIVMAKGGAERGELETKEIWQDGAGKTILTQRTQYVFRGSSGSRSVDLIATLEAGDEQAVFHDDKEGLLGMRVARSLEGAADQPQVFTDASGRPTPVAKANPAEVTGVYLTSEGKKGDAAWGTRGRWCTLAGSLDGAPVTIAILDNPRNPGSPTYWHARAYGLFAANPLGAKVFSNGKEEMNFTLAPHANVTFRYRVLILSQAATPQTVETEYEAFAAEYRR